MGRGASRARLEDGARDERTSENDRQPAESMSEPLAADPDDHETYHDDDERYRLVDLEGMGDSLKSGSRRVGASMHRFGSSLQKTLAERRDQKRQERERKEQERAERKQREQAEREEQARREREEAEASAAREAERRRFEPKPPNIMIPCSVMTPQPHATTTRTHQPRPKRRKCRRTMMWSRRIRCWKRPCATT